MIPRWHIFLGAIFTGIIWFFIPTLNWTYLLTIFLASVLIDLDHYFCAAYKIKKLSLLRCLDYYTALNKKHEIEKKRGIRQKGDFHVFHTIEFHIFIALLIYFSGYFFFIFVGMVFHSLCDLLWLLAKDRLYLREYFLFSWFKNKF